MQLLKRFFQFYIFSNIHVSIGTFCLVKLTLLSIGITENETAFFAFLANIFSYNFIRLKSISKLENWFSKGIVLNKGKLYILLVLCAVGLFFLMFKIQLIAFVWLVPFVFFTFFYISPLPFKSLQLRNIPGLKIIIISLSVAGITVLFPLVHNNMAINSDVWILFFQRFLFILIITIPFDIRDLQYDDKSLKTLPQIVGVKKAKIIGILLGVLFVMIEFLKQQTDEEQLLTLLIVSVVSVLFLINSKEKQSKYYSVFWVESLPIFWFLLMILRINM